MKRKGNFTWSVDEQEALHTAHRRFVAYRNDPGPKAPSRPPFNALERAADELRAQLESFAPSVRVVDPSRDDADWEVEENPHRRALLAYLQDKGLEAGIARTQEGYGEALEQLREALEFLCIAARQGGGRGVEPNDLAWVWVQMAGAEWRARTGEEPAEKGGRFLDALQKFPFDDPKLPRISADIQDAAMKHWKSVRRG